MMEILISILIVIGSIAICALIAYITCNIIFKFDLELVWCYITVAFLLIALFVGMVAFVYQRLF